MIRRPPKSTLFPNPTFSRSAVNEFVMTVGDRHIRGIIRERQEAQQIYQAARSQGYVASLLTQERPNVFTQSVADRKSTRLNSSHANISYAVFCLKKKMNN